MSLPPADRRTEELFSVIEELVWDGWSWDRLRKEAASSYKEAMRRHAEMECRAADKEFDR